jgi:hypothetical protein
MIEHVKDYITIAITVFTIIAGYFAYIHKRINNIGKELHRRVHKDDLKEEIKEIHDYVDRSHLPNQVRHAKTQEDIHEIKSKQDKMYDIMIEILKKIT